MGISFGKVIGNKYDRWSTIDKNIYDYSAKSNIFYLFFFVDTSWLIKLANRVIMIPRYGLWSIFKTNISYINFRLMNNKPFYELEGDGEDVYLYYYHDGKKNRYWLISKYINVLSVFGYSFEEMLCPQEMHIRSSLAGNWKWAWAECAHQLG